MQHQMNCQPLRVHQVPSRKSSDREVSAQAPSPNQLLRGATRECPRPSAYATTTPCALPSATKPCLPQGLIQARKTVPSRPSIVKSPPQQPSEISPQENAPPFRQPAYRLAPKRDYRLKEPTLKKKPKLTRVSNKGGVEEPTQKPAGKVIHTRRYGQALHKTSSSSEPDHKFS